MTLLDKEATMLRLAFEAAARGAEPGNVDAQALATAVEQLYPSEAGKLVAALDVLAGVARRVAGGQPDEERTERQRAADRVSKFLDQHEQLHGEDVSGDRITAIAHTEHVPLNASDLRLLVQAAPSLPPKWSAPLASDVVYLATGDGGESVALASLSEVNVKAYAKDHPGYSVTAVALNR